MIPQANPRASYAASAPVFLAAAQRVLASGSYILGEEVTAFEQEFAAWCGLAHGIGCANGTDALELILRGLGVDRKKVVFTVSHTAVATVAAIERAGALPWMVDIDPARLTLSPAALEEAISYCRSHYPQLEPWAILPVHIYGQAAELDSLAAIADKQGLHLVEDCAQSHGSCYRGAKTGSFGVAAAFSMYPTKNLGAFGDAGMVVTNNAALAEKLYYLRQYGWQTRYVSAVSGINSRLDPLQAAFLRIKLPTLDADNAARQRLAAIYDQQLSPLAASGILQICRPAAEVTHVYHQYVIRTPRRDQLREFCTTHGVGTAIHYPQPIHCQPAYTQRQRFPLAPGGLPQTEAVANEILSLPMYPQLTIGEANTVAEVINQWGRQAL